MIPFYVLVIVTFKINAIICTAKRIFMTRDFNNQVTTLEVLLT